MCVVQPCLVKEDQISCCGVERGSQVEQSTILGACVYKSTSHPNTTKSGKEEAGTHFCSVSEEFEGRRNLAFNSLQYRDTRVMKENVRCPDAHSISATTACTFPLVRVAPATTYCTEPPCLRHYIRWAGQRRHNRIEPLEDNL